MALRSGIYLALVSIFSLAAVVPRSVVAQHISVDGRFSPAQTLAGPNYAITASLGKQVGGNLFHSFRTFGLIKDESATFSGSAAVSNVIGRVTGGNPSSIDGNIKSTITGANLYLINPSGVVFGPNATVNVSGSFHTSTADYLKMSDGAKFQATNPDGSTLSAAPPAAFGFLTAQPAAITVNGSTLGPVPGTLGLVGGPVSVTGGKLSAPAGTIHVTSAASTGEVAVDPRNTAASTVTSFGPVDIKASSTLDVSNRKPLGSGGSVFIRSGALTIDASEIDADNYGSGRGGQLVLQSDKFTLSNKANVHAVAQAAGTGADIISSAGSILVDNSIVTVGSLAAGASGHLSVVAGQLALTHGAALRSDARGSGNGGPISVTADTVVLDGGVTLDQSTGIFSTTSGAASGGSITIIAGQLSLHNGSGTLACAAGVPACTRMLAGSSGLGASGALDVRASGALTVDSGASLGIVAFAAGNAGNVSVAAGGAVTIDMTVGAVPSILQGIGSQTVGRGNAGNVTVTADTVSILNNGEIASIPLGQGNAGSVAVTASDHLTIDGSRATSEALQTGIVSQAFAAGAAATGSGGAAGTITVSAGSVSISNGGEISGSTLGPAPGGDVSVKAGKLAIADGFILSDTLGPGHGGSVSVDVTGSQPGALTISSNGLIRSTTFGSGRGGDVSVTVAGALSIDGTSEIPQFIMGIAANTRSIGSAGTVNVTAGSLSIVNNGEISSTTSASGAAGSVRVAVSGSLTIDGSSANPGALPTGIFARTLALDGGNAGRVSVTADNISLLNSAVISISTFGRGAAGDVSVNASGQLFIDGTGTPGLIPAIASSANEGTGNGGRIAVTAGSLLLSGGGQIQSLTLALGNGGSVQVSTQGPLALSGPDSGITASAKSGASGNAGSVTVAAGSLTISGGAEIASSTAGTGAGGAVNVTTPGALVLDGEGNPNTAITASTTGPQSGPGGNVTVAANSLTVEGGAQIASSTAGPGKGGDVDVVVASDIVLPDHPGPQITARSTGSGDAGLITVSAARLLMKNGATISTEAETSTANGGNVTLSVRDFLYLIGSEITTSVATNLMPPRAAGVQAIRLTDYHVELQLGVAYTWSVSIVVDANEPSNNVVATATLMRAVPDAALDNSARGAPPLHRAALYAQAGFWYDALAAAVEGQNADHHAALDALLDQVGLTEVASYYRQTVR